MKRTQKRIHVLLRWIPALSSMAAIFYLSHQPASTLNHYLPYFQKLIPKLNSFNAGHFVAYFVLALTVYFAFGVKYANWKGRMFTILFCFLYGVTDEIHQLFVEGRSAEISDIRNDTIGATVAMLFVSIPPIHRIYVRWMYSKKY